VAETPDKEGEQPEAAPQGASTRVLAIAVSLAALAVIGAATANSLPDFNRFSLPDFSRISLPNFDHFSLPNFNRFAASPHGTPPAPTPDPVVIAALRDIQMSQQQNATVLVSLTQSSASQQSDLKRISRQLSSLAVQTEALQSAMPPLTTSSIPRANIRARVVRPPRKTIATLPKPFGPVSVGGAPLSPAPAPDPG
jgi:hypothetical protein